MIDLTDANFDEEVLHSDVPVLVDFGAGWCPPCRAMDPIVEELSQTYASTVSRSKTWRHVTMSTALPTFVFFKDGQPVDTAVGRKAKSELVEKLDALL
jgi:thioredoxin 1